MGDAMVTARMEAAKKSRGASILMQEGMSASQAINFMYDRLVEEGNARFLFSEGGPSAGSGDAKWVAAARFVDSLSVPQSTRFDCMDKGAIREDRLRARGLM